MTRFRTRNLSLVTFRPGGHSLTTTPCAAIASNSSVWAAGYGVSTPQARTATVTPSAASAPRCAAASTPNAPAGDHGQAAGSDRGGELSGHVGAVGGRRPRADDRRPSAGS